MRKRLLQNFNAADDDALRDAIDMADMESWCLQGTNGVVADPDLERQQADLVRTGCADLPQLCLDSFLTATVNHYFIFCLSPGALTMCWQERRGTPQS